MSEDSDRLMRATVVADHWRRAMVDWGDRGMPGRLAAHPLCCVLAALDGEKDPAQLGITPGTDDYATLETTRLP